MGSKSFVVTTRLLRYSLNHSVISQRQNCPQPCFGFDGVRWRKGTRKTSQSAAAAVTGRMGGQAGRTEGREWCCEMRLLASCSSVRLSCFSLRARSPRYETKISDAYGGEGTEERRVTEGRGGSARGGESNLSQILSSIHNNRWNDGQLTH
jgi:hypothetical protein